MKVNLDVIYYSVRRGIWSNVGPYSIRSNTPRLRPTTHRAAHNRLTRKLSVICILLGNIYATEFRMSSAERKRRIKTRTRIHIHIFLECHNSPFTADCGHTRGRVAEGIFFPLLTAGTAAAASVLFRHYPLGSELLTFSLFPTRSSSSGRWVPTFIVDRIDHTRYSQ